MSRWMVAAAPPLLMRGGGEQNPAYRPTRPYHARRPRIQLVVAASVRNAPIRGRLYGKGYIGGRGLSDPMVPTELALLSVKGGCIAIALIPAHGVIASVDARLVGNRIRGTDAGIVRVCLCRRNAEGRQAQGCQGRHAR